MPKTSTAAKEARRTQILDAAVRCFARRGYYETTIEDLVTETGLSRGALYLYYPSKEAMYLAISERWGCGLEEAIRARLTPDLSPASILQVLIEVNGEHVQAEADACRILMEGWNLAYYIPALAERNGRVSYGYASGNSGAHPDGNPPWSDGAVAPPAGQCRLAYSCGGVHPRPASPLNEKLHHYGDLLPSFPDIRS